MSAPIGGQTIKRANKDLGRVLALARLAIAEAGPDVLEDRWLPDWLSAAEACLPTKGAVLMRELGGGLTMLLQSPSDLAEALHSCNYGLLSGTPITMEALQLTGARVVRELVEPFLATVE